MNIKEKVIEYVTEHPKIVMAFGAVFMLALGVEFESAFLNVLGAGTLIVVVVSECK